MASAPVRLSRPRSEVENTLRVGIEAGDALYRRAANLDADSAAYHEWVRDLERWHALYRDALHSCYEDEHPADEFYSAATSGIWRRWGGQQEDETFAYRVEGLDAGINTLRSLIERLEYAVDVAGAPGRQTNSTTPDPRRVFVVHGRNELARRAMFDVLRALKLEPLEWSELVSAAESLSPYIGEVLDKGFARAQAVVVFLTPDDEARLRAALVSESDADYERELTPQARPNVLFEAGMAFSRFPDRTVIVELGSLRPFSDVAGRHTVRTSKGQQWRNDLAERLRTAGCAVSTQGLDWLSAGDFENALQGLDASAEGEKAETSSPETQSLGLRAEVEPQGKGSYNVWLRNVGDVRLEEVELVVPEDARWNIMVEELPEYPIAHLDPGDSVPVYVFATLGSQPTTRVVLRARVGDETLERSQIVSLRG